MKRTLLILSLFFSVNCLFAQKPSAGADQTIYLTQTSTANLNGSGVGAPVWTDISSDFHGGTITNPTSLSTSVTGLKQGTFYYQLAVTNGGITSKDTVVVRVEYDVPPLNSTLFRSFNMADPKNYHVVNNRGDTTSYFDLSNRQYSQTEDEKWWLFRGRSNGLMIDSSRGKLRSTNEDGYAGAKACDACAFYPRTEVQLSNMDFVVDTLNTYVFEWKGYFPQIENYLNQDGHPNWATILTMFQIHGNAYDYAITNFSLNYNGNITFNNTVVDNSLTGSGDYQPKDSLTIGFIPDFYNKSRTLRVTLKEGKGYPGQDAFIKMEMDGVTKYFRNTGGVGSPTFDDYVKFGGLYDWNSWITSKDSLARGRKYSLVTESFKIYTIPDAVVAPPTVNAGSDKTITLSSTTLSGSVTPASGKTATYLWTKISGTGGSITNSTTLTPSLSGLTNGTYIYRLTATQSDSQIAYDEITVTVNIPPPTVNAGFDKTIDISSTTLNGSVSPAPGTTVTYLWTKVSGTGSSISNSTTLTPLITGMVSGVYVFRLTATQSDGQIVSDDVNITVSIPAPTVNAGADKIISASTTSLSATATPASGQTITSTLWSKVSGTGGGITGAGTLTPSLSGLTSGNYVYRLDVTQSDGQTGFDEVGIVVNIVPPPTVTITEGSSVTITKDTITLHGVISAQAGQTVSSVWSRVSGVGTITDIYSMSPLITGLTNGTTSVFRLTVSQSDGQVSYAQISVTVNRPAPTVNAGTDKSISLGTTTLSGSVTPVSSYTATYLWTKVSGNGGTIASSTTLTPFISGMKTGTYVFRLTATQSDGQVASDDVSVIVNIPAPVANAGSNKTVTASTTTLSGSATIATGFTATFLWTKISGTGGSITNAAILTPTLSGLTDGIYVYDLQVTQSDGQVAHSQVTITVEIGTTPPVVPSSTQTIQLPGNYKFINQ